jgi:hypothetical protein
VGSHSGRYGTIILRQHSDLRLVSFLVLVYPIQSKDCDYVFVAAINNLLQMSYITVCKGYTNVFFLSFENTFYNRTSQ